MLHPASCMLLHPIPCSPQIFLSLWTRLTGKSPAAFFFCEKRKSVPHCLDILRSSCLKTAIVTWAFSRHWPFGPLQVIIGLLELSDVFLQVIFYCCGLCQIFLQGWDVPQSVRMLGIKFFLQTSHRHQINWHWLWHFGNVIMANH